MREIERRVIIITSGMIVKTVDTIDEAIKWVEARGIDQYDILPVVLPKD